MRWVKRAGAVAPVGVLVLGMAASSLALPGDGTSGTVSFVQGINPLTFGGTVGGGEFGAYEFSNPSILAPMSAPQRVDDTVEGVDGFRFQTFCMEPGQPIGFHTPLNYTVSTTVELPDGSTRNITAATAYLFTKFWIGGAFDDPYAYAPLGAARSASAANMQLAIWFVEGVSAYNGPAGSPLRNYIDEAIAETSPGGSWANLFGTTFPGYLGAVRALNLTNASGTRQQDVLVRLSGEPPSDDPEDPPEDPPPGDSVGYTPGFWHNKNGCKVMKSDLDCLEMLADLNLVNKNGSAFNPDEVKDVTNWINKADATNMASKLSSHLAAMSLNIFFGFVDPDDLVFTGTSSDELGDVTEITIGEVVELANDDLGLAGHNVTTTDSDVRDYQECLKSVLDAANNNANWVN